jgi:hypothetical protein
MATFLIYVHAQIDWMGTSVLCMQLSVLHAAFASMTGDGRHDR